MVPVESENSTKTRYCRRCLKGQYTNCNDIVRDIKRKLKIVNNRKGPESESELEKEEEDSDFENHDTCGRNGYKPLQASIEGEINLHTDGELNSGKTTLTEILPQIM